MSAIAGLYNLDEAVVDESLLTELDGRLALRGPDVSSRYIASPVGMIYRSFNTNPEQRLESQPFVSRYGHVLCWDGRLDNRDELASILPPDNPENLTDTGIVMAAYVRWGIDCLPKIIGDFALSLWDPLSNFLVLAVDIIGPRSLYFHANEERIIWSSELGSLLELSRIPLKINDEYIADFLAGLPEPGQTPYSNIRAVPTAHAVIVNRRSLRATRYWSVEPSQTLRYRTDREYEEHFRHLFREGVRCRLPVDGAVWAELSGGMDSSAIVCMANDLIKSGATRCCSLETVSRVFDRTPKSDERRYICPVEQKIGKSGLHLNDIDYPILDHWPSEYIPTLPSYAANVIAYYSALSKAVRTTGSRVLLSGLGGGELLLGDGNSFPELADLLVAGKLRQFHRRLEVWRMSLGKPYFEFLWRQVIVPLLPRRFQSATNRQIDRVLRFFNPDFCRRMDLRSRMFGPTDIFRFQSPGGRYQSISFLYALRQIAAGFWQEVCPVEFSYPFTHRPLVEFLLAIPIEQKTRPGENKSIVRRALRDLLPPELTNRKERRITIWPAAAEAVIRERSNICQLFKNARTAALGYINSEAVLAACDGSRTDLDPYVISLVPFERWFRTIERRFGRILAVGDQSL
jgi:asparagine synthase (glutamine-hydrolysing)